MKKRLSLISCFFVAGFGVNAQTSIEESKNIAIPASIEETIKWDKYGISSGKKQSNVLSPVNFGSRASSSSGIVLGESQYDLMTNASIDNRFVSHPDGSFSAGFMYSNTAAWTDRGTGYLYNNGTTWTVKNPTKELESERCGWPSIMYTGNGDEIIISHSTVTNQLIMLKRSGKGTGTWTETKDPTGANSAPKVGSGYLIWPRAVVSGPNSNIIHLVALTEPVAVTGSAFNGQLVGGMDGALVYSRSDDGGATWAVKNQILKGIDASVYTGIGGDSYAITANGNNVAIAVFHRFGDVRVLKSGDNGKTWATHIPLDFQRDAFDLGDFAVTDTPTTSDNTGDVIIDNKGMVHVFFGTWRWNDDDITDNPPMYNTFPLANGLAYWNESYGDNNHQRLFNYQDVNGDGLIGYVGYPNNFDGLTNYGAKSIVSYPSVGVNAGGDLFLKFTNLMEDGSATGGKLYNNGSRHFRHEWVTRSNDGGCTWSNPRDLTDAGAGFEECVYGVVPKKVDNKFRMIYMEDGSPGTAVGPEAHTPGKNEMVYLELNASSISSSSDICVTTIAGSNELCPGDSAVLTAIGCGSAYAWKDQFGSNLGSNAELNIVTTGVYTCDITTACGVQQESFEVVRPSSGQGPKISVSSSVAELCATGSQAVLRVNASSFGSNGSIIWDRGIPGTIDTFVVTGPGTYIVEVANCAGSTIDTIIIGTVSSVNSTITGVQFLCPGEQSTLTVPENPDGTYTWKDGGGSTIGSARSVMVSSTGTYTVDVTACGGSLTGSNSISVSAEPDPSASISIVNGGSRIVCLDPDGSVDLLARDTANVTATFKWSNGSTGSLISVPTDNIGTQSITAYSYNSCGDSALSNSITVEVVALPNKPVLSESNNVITSNTSTGLKWYFNDRRPNRWQFANETGATFDVTGKGYPSGTLIGASITDLASGCESEIGELEGFTVSVDALSANSESIAIFPNPNSGEFNINLSGITGDTAVELTINNSVGQVVYNNVIDVNSNHSEPVSLKGLDKGVYFLNVSNGSEKTTHKIVVQ